MKVAGNWIVSAGDMSDGGAVVSGAEALALARIVLAADGQPNADARQRVLMIQWPRMVELARRIIEEEC